MRRWLVITLVIAQGVVLAFMALQRELILHNGEVVYVRTAPIDPRDIFRGDFVRLDYELSPVSRSQLRDGLLQGGQRKGEKVYAVLRAAPGDLVELDYVTNVEPVSGLFIRGRLTRTHNHQTRSRLYVKYGIEQLFVEQGAGLDIEKRRGTRTGLQIPMEVALALSDSGSALIKDYRWSRLGMQLELVRTPQRNQNQASAENSEATDQPLSPKLKVTLRNVSDTNMRLLNFADHCSFELVAVGGPDIGVPAAPIECDLTETSDGNIIELEPEQDFHVELDLSEPRWHMSADDEVGEIGRVFDNWEQFRIVYRTPHPDQLASPEPGLWYGYLPSPAFNAFGRVD